MNALEESIKKRLAGGLKPTVTRVTSVSGLQFAEAGKHRTPLGQAFGFVVDEKPDLQMADIVPRLYLGSQDAAADMDSLRSHGISHILNLAGLSVTNAFSGITYKVMNWLDVPEFDILGELDLAVEFIKTALGGGGNVFVHCNAGVSRAPSAVIAYLISEGNSLADALARVKARRSAVCPNKGFMKALEAYERKAVERKLLLETIVDL